MSEDLIRRSDAIDVLYHYQESVEMGIKSFPLAVKAMNDIPTIEPKRGRWKIEDAETIYGKAYLLTCSECGETVSVTETALPYEHFCRNCGASMKEREGE